MPFVFNSVKTSNDYPQYPFGYIFGTSSYEGGVATEQPFRDDANSIRRLTYFIPSTLKQVTITGGNILYGAFYNCSSLTSVTIPDNVTTIGNSAFHDCSSLTSFTIPNDVETIGNAEFCNCSSLTDITIPDSITSIEGFSFDNCSNLTSVYYKGTANDWANISIGSRNDSLTSATHYYYSETEPELNSTGTAYNGNYWHYVDGVVTIWIKVS